MGVKQSQQYLIVNPALHTSGGRIQIVTDKQQQEEALDAVRRREILARQPSYCKILNDLKEAESDENEDCQDQQGDRQGVQEKEVGQDLVMKGEAIEVVDGGQTVTKLTKDKHDKELTEYFQDTNCCDKWAAIPDCVPWLHGGPHGGRGEPGQPGHHPASPPARVHGAVHHLHHWGARDRLHPRGDPAAGGDSAGQHTGCWTGTSTPWGAAGLLI